MANIVFLFPFPKLRFESTFYDRNWQYIGEFRFHIGLYCQSFSSSVNIISRNNLDDIELTILLVFARYITSKTCIVLLGDITIYRVMEHLFSFYGVIMCVCVCGNVYFNECEGNQL